MSERLAHLVGSLPGANSREAMRLALDACGPALRWLPDGETGERSNWTMHIVEAMRAHPDLELARDGGWSSYEDTPRFKVRRGAKLAPTHLDLGYASAFEASFATFEALRVGRDDLAFQVGIPGDLDLAMLILGFAGGLRHRGAFRAATVREIGAIHARSPEVVFQLEVPFELVMVARVPAPLRGPVASRLGRGLARLAGSAPAGARFGVHLCLGDLNHKALMNMRDAGPVVALANGIAAAWPADRPLEFVHAPFAGASQPPPSDPAFYAPLERLALGTQTAFIAGCAFEHSQLEDQQRLVAEIERRVGRRVGVAAACGLGRRSRQDAEASLERVRALL